MEMLKGHLDLVTLLKASSHPGDVPHEKFNDVIREHPNEGHKDGEGH